jgi:ATP/maltotriose-dependent transcriptional regulator MalT
VGAALVGPPIGVGCDIADFFTDPGLDRVAICRTIGILPIVAKSHRRIAEKLTMSATTVDRHVSHILSKIGAANRAEAAAYAARQRLIS